MFPSPAYGKDLMEDELRLPKISEKNYTPSCTEESKMDESEYQQKRSESASLAPKD